ncbi:MAG: hypothetical protein ACKOOL_10820 [Novosphingobium sp.]
MTKQSKPLTGWQIAAVGGIFAAMIGAEIVTRRNLTPAERAKRAQDKAQHAAKSAADRSANDATFWREQDAKDAYSSERNSWAQSAKGQAIILETTGKEFPVREPFPDVSVKPAGKGYSSGTTFRESVSAGARFGAYTNYEDGRHTWNLRLDGETIGGELERGTTFVLKCQQSKGHMTERQRDTVLRLLGTSGGPRSVIFQRWYDNNEIDQLYRKYGG